jgi:hypothetical protein
MLWLFILLAIVSVVYLFCCLASIANRQISGSGIGNGNYIVANGSAEFKPTQPFVTNTDAVLAFRATYDGKYLLQFSGTLNTPTYVDVGMAFYLNETGQLIAGSRRLVTVASGEFGNLNSFLQVNLRADDQIDVCFETDNINEQTCDFTLTWCRIG